MAARRSRRAIRKSQRRETELLAQPVRELGIPSFAAESSAGCRGSRISARPVPKLGGQILSRTVRELQAGNPQRRRRCTTRPRVSGAAVATLGCGRRHRVLRTPTGFYTAACGVEVCDPFRVGGRVARRYPGCAAATLGFVVEPLCGGYRGTVSARASSARLAVTWPIRSASPVRSLRAGHGAYGKAESSPRRGRNMSAQGKATRVLRALPPPWVGCPIDPSAL